MFACCGIADGVVGREIVEIVRVSAGVIQTVPTVVVRSIIIHFVVRH